VVWYSIIGTGNLFKITTCSPYTDFPTQVTVTSGCPEVSWDCTPSLVDDECSVNANSASYEWITVPGQKYEISVGGKAAGQMGYFELQVTEYVLPKNAYCASPEFIPDPQGGNVTVSGSTVNAVEIPMCGIESDAVWYVVIGNGNNFTVSTCSPNTDFPTQVTVNIDCGASSWFDELECVSSTVDSTCSVNANGASYTWTTTANQKYEISVSGREPGVQGNFELTLTEL
jgi:hypothetical protein